VRLLRIEHVLDCRPSRQPEQEHAGPEEQQPDGRGRALGRCQRARHSAREDERLPGQEDVLVAADVVDRLAVLIAEVEA